MKSYFVVETHGLLPSTAVKASKTVFEAFWNSHSTRKFQHGVLTVNYKKAWLQLYLLELIVDAARYYYPTFLLSVWLRESFSRSCNLKTYLLEACVLINELCFTYDVQQLYDISDNTKQVFIALLDCRHWLGGEAELRHQSATIKPSSSRLRRNIKGF